MHADSISLPQRKSTGHKRSVAGESLSLTISETSTHGSRRAHDRTVIFQTRFDYALVIIGLQTNVTQLMFIFIQVEKYGGVIIFCSTFILTICISLPLMVHQIFYGFYNKYGYIKFWNMAPVGFGIGLSMALYSVYECVIWASIAGLLILHTCHIPFRSISEWMACEKTERPEGVLCYDAESKLPSTSCDLATYPGIEFYKGIAFKPQEGSGSNGINGAWFVCCFIVWLLIFVMVSQGFRRLKHMLIKIPIACLLSLTLLVVFSFGTQKELTDERKHKIFDVQESPTRYTVVWLVWHAIRVVQIPLGTLSQLGSHSPPGSPLLADAVMILLFVCLYNFTFAYFAHCCLAWIEQTFVAIKYNCIGPDGMTSLFATVPTAISFLAMGNIWLFVFYSAFALKTITQIVITLTATMNAMAEIFHLRRHRQQIVAVLCTVGLFLNLPLTMMNSDMFYKRTNRFVEFIVDLVIVSSMFVVTVCLYTLTRFFDDIHFAYNAEPVIFQKLITYLAPVLMIFATITAFTWIVSMWPVDIIFKIHPWAAPYIGIMVFLILVPIPGFALYMYVVHLMKHNISAMLQPTANWGPQEADVKHARLNFNPRTELRYKSKKPCAHNCLLNNLRIKIEVEKRDSQRKEFFLNVFQSPSYAEWDDDEDWHHGNDIIGKARAINWAGDRGTHHAVRADTRRVFNPMVTKEGDEEERRIEAEDVDAAEEDDNSQENVEKAVKLGDNDTTVNVLLHERFILKKDTSIKAGTNFMPDIILPDLNSYESRPRIWHLDTHDAVDRTLPSPRYTGELPMSLHRRKSRRERVPEILIEPPPTWKKRDKRSSVDKKPKRQSRSKSCQTDKGLKRLQNIVQAMLPWKKDNRKKHRCVGTSPDAWPSGYSSERSETLSDANEWP